MSSPSLTLQCRQCSGVFATPKTDFTSLIKCPHCATAAALTDFESLEESAGSPPGSPLSGSSKSEGSFQVRGKWLQFDCPHCVRPMRLILEDAGGLVDCAHCGLELIAPDPTIGRGAQLSRASEGRVGSISRFNLRDLRGDQLKHSKQQKDDTPFSIEDNDDYEEEEEELDPNHALARSAAATPAEPGKRAVKAVESGKLGRAFRRQEVIAEQAIAASDTEWEPQAAERPSFGESRQDRYGFWIALGLAGAVMLGIVTMIVKEAGKSGDVFDESEMDQINASQITNTSNFQDSFKTAQRALASPSWEGLAPHIRDPKRVVPLMRAYYSEVEYFPIELTSFHAPVNVDVGGLSMHEMKMEEASGETRTLVLEQSSEGPKIDWELMVNYPRYQWGKFLETKSVTPQTIRVIASRSSVLDQYFSDAGLTREDAFGLRLWHRSDENFFAIVPKDSDLAKKLSRALEWNTGRKIIVEASFDPDSELEDRLRLNDLVQTGWVIE